MAPAFVTTFIEDVRQNRDRWFLALTRVQWKSLTNFCKGLLIVCIIQTIILIGFSIASMVMFSARLSDQNDIYKEIAYGLLVIVSSIFFIYFAFDAVRSFFRHESRVLMPPDQVMNENKFEMVAFAAVSILLTVIAYMFYANYVRVPSVWMLLG